MLFGCTFAFFLHLCGGIRHLVWDTVHGFELRSIYISGWAVVAASIALTVAAWVASLLLKDRADGPSTHALAPGSRHRASARQKRGSRHWWAERVSAVALVPLTLWFVASIIAHTGSDYATFIAWLRTPLVSHLMILLLIALFYHTALGLQVVIEDYVHSGVKFAALVAVRLGCFALAAAGIVATLRIAFSG